MDKLHDIVGGGGLRMTVGAALGFASGQALQRGLGWRKALRSALADNPFVKGQGLSPRARRELLGQAQRLPML